MLALFNEVIVEEAVSRRLPLIDLRLTCCESGEYSELSPIEPSEQGGQKIVDVIARIAVDPNPPADGSVIRS